MTKLQNSVGPKRAETITRTVGDTPEEPDAIRTCIRHVRQRYPDRLDADESVVFARHDRDSNHPKRVEVERHGNLYLRVEVVRHESMMDSPEDVRRVDIIDPDSALARTLAD